MLFPVAWAYSTCDRPACYVSLFRFRGLVVRGTGSAYGAFFCDVVGLILPRPYHCLPACLPACVANRLADPTHPALQMAMLRSHIDRMGLEASGRLKSDLQQCLCNALRDGHSGKGSHASRRTAGKARAAITIPKKKKRSGGSGAEADAEADADMEDGAAEPDEDEGEEDEEPGRGRGRSASASQSDRRGRGKGRETEERADQAAEKSPHRPLPVPVLPPSKVLFHNKAVSAMTQEERREALQELDMASLRKDDDEVTHDLVDALVLRKAEAADTNPRKQAWRGRHVYMMRKAELADMLGDFELDDTGKVEEMRTRFRKALRKWASEEITLPASGASASTGESSAGAGASASASVSNSEEEADVDESSVSVTEEEEASSGNKRRGQSMRRQTRSEDAAANPKSKPPRATASRKSPSPSKEAAKETRSASASASASRRRQGRSGSIISVDDVVASSRSRSRSRRGDPQPEEEEKAASSSSSWKKPTASRKAKATATGK